LRKAGLNIDLQVMDAVSANNRILNKETRDKGGWNIFFSILEGLFNANPATNNALRGDGKSGMPGWPRSPVLEALRYSWLDASDFTSQMRISEQMQLQLWQDVPYIPLGHWVPLTAHRSNIADLPWGFPQFYGVRRV